MQKDFNYCTCCLKRLKIETNNVTIECFDTRRSVPQIENIPQLAMQNRSVPEGLKEVIFMGVPKGGVRRGIFPPPLK